MVQGTGELNRLILQYVPETGDVAVGDKITTSALGGRFPPGFALGHVSQVLRKEQQTFASIDVVPASDLKVLRFILILEPLKRSIHDQDVSGAQ